MEHLRVFLRHFYNVVSYMEEEKTKISASEKKALFKQLTDLKKDIKELRDKLNEVSEQKEKWFRKKEEFNRKISEVITDIKSSKQARNVFTKQVKEGKEKREEFNKTLKDKVVEVKKLNEEKDKIMQKHNIKGDPGRFKEDIDKLERKMETEPMSFDKEKELMKKIKALKKKYNEGKKVSDVWEKIRSLNKEIKKLKQSADESHQKIQSRAKESQIRHEQMISKSGEVDKLKEEEKKVFAKFIEFKKQFTEINNDLKAKLAGLSEINSKVSEFKQFSRNEKAKRDEETLKIKESDVKEKIKKRQKLTTEDLLVFQKSEEGE